MDNQHKFIKGYRDLSQEEIDLMNEIKVHAESIRELVEQVQAYPGIDPRWAAMGKSDLQKGFMFLTRAVAQPTTF